MKATREKSHWIRIKNENKNGSSIFSQSVEANLLFMILEKLEKIRCGIIDVENSVDCDRPNPR
jgi:hypothetical protein